MTDPFAYHENLRPLAEADVEFLVQKDRSYGASWKKSGGRSAWFMLVRKMDRLMEIMRRPEAPPAWSALHYEEAIPGPREFDQDVTVDASIARFLLDSYLSEDIFLQIEDAPTGEDGSALAEIRDLRRYLLLVEAEMVYRGVVEHPRDQETGPVPQPLPNMGHHVHPVHPATLEIIEPERRCEWKPGSPTHDEPF
jgi:hypothetical protein